MDYDLCIEYVKLVLKTKYQYKSSVLDSARGIRGLIEGFTELHKINRFEEFINLWEKDAQDAYVPFVIKKRLKPILNNIWSLSRSDRYFFEKKEEQVIFFQIAEGISWVKNSIFHRGAADILYTEEHETLDKNKAIYQHPFLIRNYTQRLMRILRPVSSSVRPRISTWYINSLGVGNCGEYAAAAYVYARSVLPCEYYAAIAKSSVMDHSFCLISRTPITYQSQLDYFSKISNNKIVSYDEKIYVFDSWLKKEERVYHLKDFPYIKNLSGKLTASIIHKMKACKFDCIAGDMYILEQMNERYNVQYYKGQGSLIEKDLRKKIKTNMKVVEDIIRFKKVVNMEYMAREVHLNELEKWQWKQFNFVFDKYPITDQKTQQYCNNFLRKYLLQFRQIFLSKGNSEEEMLAKLTNLSEISSEVNKTVKEYKSQISYLYGFSKSYLANNQTKYQIESDDLVYYNGISGKKYVKIYRDDLF